MSTYFKVGQNNTA